MNFRLHAVAPQCSCSFCLSLIPGMGGCWFLCEVLESCVPGWKIDYTESNGLESSHPFGKGVVSLVSLCQQWREEQLSQGADQSARYLAAALNQWLKEKQGGRWTLLGQSDNVTLLQGNLRGWKTILTCSSFTWFFFFFWLDSGFGLTDYAACSLMYLIWGGDEQTGRGGKVGPYISLKAHS